jgi:hypothetical protein
MIQIHILLEELDQQVFDMEIYFDLQAQPWQGVEPIAGPPGWESTPITESDPTGGDRIVGIRFFTSTAPLVTCQPVTFHIAMFPPQALGNFIKIYLTDKDHNVIGQIAAQRVAPNPDLNAFHVDGRRAWLASTLAPACQS